ncbi:selenium-dependent molybdenum cofactor biosynthesis protein YqeB [Desulfospira joergensenii]|uniref:selenium-dependent molybdenum cofactor biosynthesis protein YqeB n=1 Tax=Desulfospira joergensenii TaxID=53329 RepID=UPI00041374E9|nr:selenium-dependent molybdenum cofactor biosynthesis protein YqeB [Desulfospira joergensenii]
MKIAKEKTGNPRAVKDLIIAVKGGGDLATGIVCRLYRARIRNIYVMEAPMPTAVRRKVAFAQALYQDRIQVEGVTACRARTPGQIPAAWEKGHIPVLADPGWESLKASPPDILIDAVIAKKNLGTRISDAALVLGLGPGFEAGRDVHRVIETKRGHSLGQVITSGSALENTSVPEAVMGYSSERVIRAPAPGTYRTLLHIGDRVSRGQEIGRIGNQPVTAPISGVIRGLVHDGVALAQGKKLGDVDPRDDVRYCSIISDKARALGGAVLEAVLERFNL